ncbi:uncharacterized protein LOC9661955 [Selaginella moellendorffii]|uniref:uncharacterized protein LOC9661955 n=1 Tax=Selaginella moellendorffii TaxID=88036 RepID=UPI000D1C4096|nr:uncharacterized protein LOC9661955 [Selaginella moellendorffii]|eukprot:XP_002982906.2 uncharacterized protein LOC9661955 [Selaginella moellendorffii]
MGSVAVAPSDLMGPAWLKPLLQAAFFEPCSIHSSAESSKCECNLFCLDCAKNPLCSACTSYHRAHRIVQIRRSSYHDVIRVSEIQKCLDLSGVQSYIINSARVVFLNQRPQPRHAKGVTNTCEICDRSLLDTFKFCSLGCKLEWIQRHYKSANDIVSKPQASQQQQRQATTAQGQKRKTRSSSSKRPLTRLPSARDEQEHEQQLLLQNSIEEDDELSPDGSTVSNNSMSSPMAVAAAAAEDEPKETVNSINSISPQTPPRRCSSRSAKRRKGVPHRSPL